MHRLTAPALAIATLTAAAATTCALAADKPKIPGSVKSKAPKAVAKLVSGEIEPNDTKQRGEVIASINKLLAKDKKNAALKAPAFWIEAIMDAPLKIRSKAAARNRIVQEDMDVVYEDESPGRVPIVFRNGALAGVVTPLLVTVLPKGTDAKAWLEANWATEETAKKGWAVAAVVESDKYPVSSQPFLIANAFGHMMQTFRTDPNRWFLEGVGEACVAAQKAAAQNMPDRLAGLILRDPTTAITNVNSKLYSTYVLDGGAAAEVGKAYTDLDAERNHVAAAGDTALADIAAWVTAHPGRHLSHDYEFVTASNEKRIVAPFTGSLFLVSPGKRGDDVTAHVQYDMAAGAVTISGSNIGEFVVYMNDDLVDLDKPVTITCNGAELVTRVFERDLKSMFDTADTFGEYGRVFTAQYRGFAPSEVSQDVGDGAGGDDGGDKKDDAGK